MGTRRRNKMKAQELGLAIVETKFDECGDQFIDEDVIDQTDNIKENVNRKTKTGKTQKAQIGAQEGNKKMIKKIEVKGDVNNLNLTTREKDYEQQHQYVEDLKAKGEVGFSLVATEAFVEGMRDSGYRSTATAIDEFIDNAIQAAATRIDIVYDEDGKEIKNIAVIDDGHGMEPDMIRAAVVWGGTHRRNDRTSFGRFGFGLPSAAVSIAKYYEVYSKTDGFGWHKVVIDLPEICSGTKYRNERGIVVAPLAVPSDLPKYVKENLEKRELTQGTVINIQNPDRLSQGFRKKAQFHSNMMEHIGLIYRHLLRTVPIYLNGNKILPVDPLFLDPTSRFYDVGDGVFAIGRDELIFDVKTSNSTEPGKVRIKFSLLPPPNFQKNKDRFSIMKDTQAFLIVTRAGRQIDLVRRLKFPKEELNYTLVNFDRNWAVELDFDPVLDEEFGITVNKQQVSISDRIWTILQDQGVAAMIKSLRADAEKMRKIEIADVKPGTDTRESEIVMTEADKFSTTPPVTPPEKEEKAKDRVVEEAKKKAKESGRPEIEHVKELAEEAHKRPYKIHLESRGVAAPFYRMELFGAQRNLYLNSDHTFFIKLYAAEGTSPRLKSALEILLFILGSCEVEAGGDRELFYQSERAEWSKRLNVTLNLLDRKEPIDDAEEAKEFGKENDSNAAS